MPRALGAGLLALCLLLVILEPAPMAWLRDAVFDGYQKLMPRERGSAPAVIVEIDERSLDARGQWPWPRTLMAELIEAVNAAGPAAVGIDLLFVEPDRSMAGADAALARALAAGPTALGIAGLEVRDRRFPFPPQVAPVRLSGTRELPLRRFDGHLQSRPEINKAAAGRGLISVDAPDRVIRRVPMMGQIAKVLVPSLTAEVVRIAAGEPGLRVEDSGGEEVRLGIGDVSIPIQSDGTMAVYFGAHDPQRLVSAEDVLSGKAQGLLRDKLVLVGVTGVGLLDFQATPLGERIPGVEVHQQILEQIFDGVYLRRPTAATTIEAVLLALAGILFIVLVPRRGVLLSLAALLGVLLAFAAMGVGAFKAGILLNMAAPAGATALIFGAVLAATLAESQRQRRLLREAQAKMAGELEAARRIQMGMLPSPSKVFAGEKRFSLSAALEPARTVGGDFYDCFMVDRHRLFFLVADVSGKGLPASLFMALAKSLIKSLALRADNPDPGALLTRANVEIDRDNPESLFVTVFAGLLDTRTGSLQFCNAGHEPPRVRGAGAATHTLQHEGGPPLCVVQGFEYPTGHRVLRADECLCVVSDGVTEAMNKRGELYGAARLSHVLAALKTPDPDTVLADVTRDVAAFVDGADPSDDLTLLCVRWEGAGSEGLAPSEEEDFEISER
jgi:serine phosphatase RsbU (regulator of sigma subunit)/CHASE2 domain-containing sensor protein